MADRKKVFRGDRLKEIREKRGLTQEELNNRLNFGSTQVYRYETGKADPSLDVIIRMARALEVSTDWLLGLVDKEDEQLQAQDLSAREWKAVTALRRDDLKEYMRVVVEEAEPKQ